MTNTELISLWNELVQLPDIDREFKGSTYGRHQETLSDGWRTIVYSPPYGERIAITLEKQPGAWIIYSGLDRYYLSEEVGEKMVSLFDEIEILSSKYATQE